MKLKLTSDHYSKRNNKEKYRAHTFQCMDILTACKLEHTTKGIVKPRTDKQYDIFQMDEFV